jgi:succinyl-diaminopimelate desuccinylase
MYTGGGTYAKALPGGVAFGPAFPGSERLEHKVNEYISVENLLKITEIYAEAIRRLSEL